MTTVIRVAVGWGALLGLAACGESGGTATAGVVRADDAVDAADAPFVAPPIDAQDAAALAPCGGQAERCCTEGALCGPGLTCSDEFCLACGPAPAPLAGCTNVAAGAGVAVTSGVYPTGSEVGAANAVVDNDVCTPWNYGNYGDANAFFEVDLGAVTTLDGVTLWPKMTPADGRVRLSLQHRKDAGSPWTSYPTSEGVVLTLHDYAPWQMVFEPALSARYFRVTILDTPSFAALREVSLYAHCGGKRDGG